VCIETINRILFNYFFCVPTVLREAFCSHVSQCPDRAETEQDAQLSQFAERPRCRMRYSFRQKWKTGTGKQYFTDIIGLSSTTVHDIIGLKICQIRWKTQNEGYYGVQGHSRLSRSVQIESPYAISY